MLSLDQVRLRHQVKLRNRSAMLLDRLLKKPERLLVTILLVTNLADIAGLLLLTRRLVHSLGVIGLSGRAAARRADLSFSCSACCRSRSSAASLIAPSPRLPACSYSLRASSGRSWNWAHASAGSLPAAQDATPRIFAAREDLKQLTVESERQGSLTSAERAMIHNVVDFRTVKVADVMRPLRKVVSVRPETTCRSCCN